MTYEKGAAKAEGCTAFSLTLPLPHERERVAAKRLGGGRDTSGARNRARLAEW